MKRLRVMILDDEERILHGLERFDWEAHGCALSAKAKNGAEGLEKLEEARPDIIVSDIKMPVMGGLEFAKEARKRLPEVQIILLTGYDEFEYAKSAIGIGVREYLLKPLNFAELSDLLKRLCKEHEDARLKEQKLAEFMERYRIATPVIRQQYVGDLVRGNIRDRKEIEKRMESIDVTIENYVCVKARVYKSRPMESWLREFAVMNMAESMACGYCQDLLTCMDGADYCLVVIFGEGESERRCADTCVKFCEELQKAVGSTLGEEICFGISLTDRNPCNIPHLMEEASAACDQSSFLGNDSIVQYADIRNRQNDWKTSDGQKRRINTLVSTGDIDGIEEMVRSIFGQDEDWGDGVRIRAMDLLCSLILYSEPGKAANTAKLLHESTERIYGAKNAGEVKRYVLKLLVILANSNKERTNDKNQSFVGSMLGYLELHYKNDISLDELADEFHVSKNYVTRLLKRYTGKSFSENVLRIRMNKAVELITSTDYSISRVGDLVGYHDTSYFIQVFKKQMGVTPNDYKRLY